MAKNAKASSRKVSKVSKKNSRGVSPVRRSAKLGKKARSGKKSK